jgi:acyl transferase domain-containing protein/NAD(P)H-dependent flavin oxidoreductase YrpB (nitropropane dioxygenase family)/acyl carrier protein
MNRRELKGLGAAGVSVVGVSPFGYCDDELVAALSASGIPAALDVSQKGGTARSKLERLARLVPHGFGLCLGRCPLAPADVPTAVEWVILSTPEAVHRWKPRTVLVQVTSIGEARQAAAAGADGLIAKGSESGGRVGDETSFVLLQRLVGEIDLPIWVQGGVGLHSAAACIAGGAAGVVLDSQLALVTESTLPRAIKSAVALMDGSETVVIGGHRVYTRPDLPVAELGDARPDDISDSLGTDLHESLVPIGQDAAFAKSLADRFQTAAGVAKAIRESIDHHLRVAKAVKPLAPESPLATEHHIRYPILQGPMTRVSDRAAFIDAVSKGGGLPFLALALMRGPEVSALARETAGLLGKRTWGVGILGFVPPELREEQLNALGDAKPPVVIIAGGRPSQARPLEAQGISVYHHVPSPGLLDLFLKDGARRFIFEGRECGGHVGPRSSFVLWELQIERLLAFEHPEELFVVFAGGIHDARSAAMVAAASATLAERGARVGVLMGTAYLFTEEAVATGAILADFQKVAVECENTALLETAPGHAVRCADTEFVEAFEEEKRRLEAQGTKGTELWKALETLNVGRLRLASKGVLREGDRLVEVDPTTQRRDGMYMLGQVASLRDRVCSIADLHRDVSAGSAELIARLPLPERRRPTEPAPKPADVAIVGMACVFPGAPDLQTYWANIVGAVNSITEVPKERWNSEHYYDPESKGSFKTPSKWGGFIPDVAFDALSYGIPPRSLASIDPIQLLALEVARRALDDAGYAQRPFDRERASVIFAAAAGSELMNALGFRALYPQIHGSVPKEVDESLPSLTEDSFPGVLANVIAGRIANRLDLGGVNYTVDAACASSLAAVDLAIKELVAGTSDLVLCGSADTHNSIGDYALFASVHALSPTGQCRTFDAEADGIALGEGVACLVLKRLSDAERDGDRVYAVIKGIAGSSDGRSLGLTAPRQEGQMRALERAYARSQVSPAQVGLVEAHGTGTVVGDRTELATLTQVFSKAGSEPGSCALGSVKSQIGHTKCSAGLAGMIKVALSLHHRVLPPTLNVKKPNPAYEPGKSPFVLASVPRPWVAEERIAALSAFGFGGANFHAVVAAQGPTPSTGLAAWPAELFLFRAKDRAGALRQVEQIQRMVSQAHSVRLRDLARTTWASGEGAIQIAVVARDRTDLQTKLEKCRLPDVSEDGIYLASPTRGRVAFLFPGQGSQRPGMLQDLFVAFPRLHTHLAKAAHIVDRIFPSAAYTPAARDAQAAALTDTRVAQPALGTVEMALVELLGLLGVRPDLLGGHSYGELAALCVAGTIAETDLVPLSEARAAAILSAAGGDPGTMAAVAGDFSAVDAAIRGIDGVVVANYNAPTQTVISGTTSGVTDALNRLQAAGLSARRLPVACAFHSPVVASAHIRFAEQLNGVSLRPPQVRTWSNLTAKPYPSDPEAIRTLLAGQVANPVRFVDEIEAMYRDGARIFVEVGPGRVLTDLVGKILAKREYVAVACDQSGQNGLEQLLKAVAQLAVRDVPVELAPLFAGRDARVIDLDNPPKDPKGPGAWMVNGGFARPVEGEPPRGGLRPIVRPIVTAAPVSAAPSDRDAAMVEYLRNMREAVRAQRDVMLGFLGQRPPVEAPTPVAVVAPAPAKLAIVEAKAELVAAPDTGNTQEKLLALVSEKTGYPSEMLGLDLDLEADLSIDSIKRVEILGALGTRIGLRMNDTAERDAVIEQLARIKTLRGIVQWIEARSGTTPETVAVMAPRAEALPEPVAAIESGVSRFVLEVERAPLPTSPSGSLQGKTFGVTDAGGGVAEALVARLQTGGAKAHIVRTGEPIGRLDGLIDLASLSPEGAAGRAKVLFELAREAIAGGATQLLGVTGFGGLFGRSAGPTGPLMDGGVSGLLKTVAVEWPGVRVRALDLDLRDDASRLVDQICAELSATDSLVDVGYAGGSRQTLRLSRAERPDNAELPAALGRDSVLLVTGGGRGITARVCVALAQRFGCRFELVGRSPPPDVAEGGGTRQAQDAVSLRKALLSIGVLREPAAIERECARILAAREIRETLAAITAAGGTVSYHAVDVRDAEAFGAVIDDVYARHGRVDGVIHGAGVIEDKLLRDKSRESFSRVFDTKVEGALTLAKKLRDHVRFVVFFSSVSGVFGNRGQGDYAAANDAMDKIAVSLSRRMPGRVLSVNWGPWSGTGMVSPELEREYARRGLGLILPTDGVQSLLRELGDADSRDAQVILMRGDASRFVGPGRGEA